MRNRCWAGDCVTHRRMRMTVMPMSFMIDPRLSLIAAVGSVNVSDTHHLPTVGIGAAPQPTLRLRWNRCISNRSAEAHKFPSLGSNPTAETRNSKLPARTSAG